VREVVPASGGLARLAPAVALAIPGRALWGQSAAAAPPHFMGALMSGMVILMVPAFLICTGITVLAYRKRKQWAQTEGRRTSARGLDAALDADDEPWR
jgi:hypothetical protein